MFLFFVYLDRNNFYIDRAGAANDDNSIHIVNRSGALFTGKQWRLYAFPWQFPYGIGDTGNKDRRVAFGETDADVQLLQRW